MRLDRLAHRLSKELPVDGQSSARRHLVAIGAGDDDRAQPPHLFFQQARGTGEPVCAQRVGTDELSQVLRVMRRGHLARAHLVEVDVDSQVGRLPGSLTAREAAADDGYSLTQLATPPFTDRIPS